jgi:predicted N-acetyltransferase YhbS
VPNGAIKLPGPADPARILAAELVEGALQGVSGVVRPDWEA